MTKRKKWCVYSKKTKTVFAIGPRRDMERTLKVFRRARWINITITRITL